MLTQTRNTTFLRKCMHARHQNPRVWKKIDNRPYGSGPSRGKMSPNPGAACFLHARSGAINCATPVLQIHAGWTLKLQEMSEFILGLRTTRHSFHTQCERPMPICQNTPAENEARLHNSRKRAPPRSPHVRPTEPKNRIEGTPNTEQTPEFPMLDRPA